MITCFAKYVAVFVIVVIANIYWKFIKFHFLVLFIILFMTAINVNWLHSVEGESLMHHFYINTSKKRRFYGKE